jgi:ABC-type Fe3+-siderophore transport system permease subunit
VKASLVLCGAALALALAPWIGPLLDADTGGFVLLQLRLPRAALGALVGASLGLVGAVFQVLFDNPLAAPSTLGTTAGASLGALVVLLVWPAGVAVAGGAFVGALGVTGTVAVLAASRRMAMADLLLAGIAVSLAASALSLGLQATADAATTFRAVRWSLGSLATVGWDVPLALLPVVVVAGAVLLGQVRALQTMAAGAAQAATQGVDVIRVRWTCLAAGSLLVGAVVAAVGPLAFVGLLVPHLVRRVHGHAPRSLLPLSAAVGAGLLPLADGVARVVVPGRELPVGVITALIGAPALLALLLARRQG